MTSDETIAPTRELATGTVAAQHLLALAESLLIYPKDIDSIEAAELRVALMRELLRSLEAPAWGETKQLVPEDFDPFEQPETVACVLAVGLGLLAGSKDISAIDPKHSLVKAHEALPPDFLQLLDRVQEVLVFNCRIPDPSVDAEYRDPCRFFFLLTKYWALYRDMLIQHGSAPIGYSPHPLLRFIINLKDRIRTCLKELRDDGLTASLEDVIDIPFNQDTNLAYEDWVQPRIEAASETIEGARLRFKRASFSLTKSEDLFIRVSIAALGNLKASVSTSWKKMLKRAEEDASRARTIEPKESIPASCFESIGLLEQTLRGVVEARYRRTYAETWLTKIQSALGSETYQAAVGVMKQRGVHQLGDVLHYINLKDLVAVVSNNWELFQETFNGKKKDFNRLMAPVLKGRTEEAHHRPERLWPEIEKQRVRVACHDLITRLTARPQES